MSLNNRTLADWLAWQETLHPSAIDMGLERVAQVRDRMRLGKPAPVVITVTGTNGKGSTVAMLEAIYRAAGYRVAAYTSPHLLHYNERIRVDGAPVSDAEICAAFARVDDARASTSLTYFEFGTLAALDIFARSQLDVAILEVGLGGRLDAVNIIDADVAVVTSIGIDHTEWLGPDRDSIGYEKAGIFRAGRPAVCGDPRPPQRLLDYAATLGATLYRFERDYHAGVQAHAWTWQGPRSVRSGMPQPFLRGAYQLQNAAGVLMVIDLLSERLPVAQAHIRAGLTQASLPGRFQVLATPVPTILDVAHNPEAAAALAGNLRAHPCSGGTLAVFGMLRDKDIAAVVRILDPLIAEWHVAGLPSSRAASALETAQALEAAAVRGMVVMHPSIVEAYRGARDSARGDDRIVVFGSFYAVSEFLASGLGNEAG